MTNQSSTPRPGARAFWVMRPGVGEIREQALAGVATGQVLVRTVYSGVSRGTERLVFQGRVPVSEYRRMRAPFQEGDFPGPVKYGYASVGVVEQGPDALREKTVFCLYPHQERYVVDSGDVLPLPAGVPAQRAVLAANMETALNALWDAAPRIGDRVAVVGAGAVGCLVAWLAGRIPGTRVELVDTLAERAAVAAALGIGFALPENAHGDADLVVHTSATASGLDTSLALAGDESTVLELSWYGDAPVSVHLGGAFHARRLTIAGSQVGSVSPARRARCSHRQRLALALTLLDDAALDVLLTGEDAFADLPAVMARLASGEPHTLCHRIRY